MKQKFTLQFSKDRAWNKLEMILYHMKEKEWRCRLKSTDSEINSEYPELSILCNCHSPGNCTEISESLYCQTDMYCCRSKENIDFWWWLAFK